MMRRLILVLLLFFLPRYTNPDHWNSKSSGLKSKAPKGQPPAPKPSKGISHNHHHYIEKDAIHDQPDYKPNDLDFRHPPLLISLHSKMSKAYPEGLKSIEFCKNCEDPFRNGSQIRGLTAAQGPKDYSIQSDLVYAVPNDGRERLLNAHELEGRIVLFDRGEISLVEKVLKAQAEGASGVIIVDNGQCDEEFVRCGRAGSVKEGGFGKYDLGEHWRKVEIPAIMVTSLGGQRLKNLLHLRHMEIPGYGMQYTEDKGDD